MELDDLVGPAVRGTPRAWRTLSRALKDELRRYLTRTRWRFDGPAVDVEDVSQNTLSTIARKLPGYEFREGKPFLAWVHGIARLEALKAQDQQRRSAAQKNAAALIQRTPSTGLSAQLRRAELLGVLDQEIAKLPAAYRRAVEHAIEKSGESASLAVQEDISPGAARTRLYRARLMLSERLAARMVTPGRSSPSSSPPPPP